MSRCHDDFFLQWLEKWGRSVLAPDPNNTVLNAMKEGLIWAHVLWSGQESSLLRVELTDVAKDLASWRSQWITLS